MVFLVQPHHQPRFTAAGQTSTPRESIFSIDPSPSHDYASVSAPALFLVPPMTQSPTSQNPWRYSTGLLLVFRLLLRRSPRYLLLAGSPFLCKRGFFTLFRNGYTSIGCIRYSMWMAIYYYSVYLVKEVPFRLQKLTVSEDKPLQSLTQVIPFDLFWAKRSSYG